MQTEFELLIRINKLEAEKKELLHGLEQFTIWPIHIEASKTGLYPALAHAEVLVKKYNPQPEQQ